MKYVYLLLPVTIALAAVLAFALVQQGSSDAATDGASMVLEIAGQQGKVEVDVGSSFQVDVIGDQVPKENGYIQAQAWLQFGNSGLTFKNSTTTWPDCFEQTDISADTSTSAWRGCITAIVDFPASFYKGELFSFTLTCPAGKSSHTIDLEPSGGPNAGTKGALYREFDTINFIVPTVQGIDVNCGNAGPTITPTPTPTSTPTATPFPAPVAITGFWNITLGGSTGSCLMAFTQTGTALDVGAICYVPSPMPLHAPLLTAAGALDLDLGPCGARLRVAGEAVARLTGPTLGLYDTEGAQAAALAAGVGMGLYAPPADAFVGIEPLFTVEPDDRSRSAYAHLNERWQAALRRALQ